MVLYPARFIEEWLEGNVHGGEDVAPACPAPLPISKPKKKRPHRFGGLKTKALRAREREE